MEEETERQEEDRLAEVPPALLAMPTAERATVVEEFVRVLLSSEDDHAGHDYIVECEQQRTLAERWRVPYLVVHLLVGSFIANPDVTADDIADYVRWCERHAPERAGWRKEA
jgi:hypothetical protein